MTILRFLVRTLITLVIFTAIGQIPVRSKSIENHYHGFVNSAYFQKGFWTLVRPITWTNEKTRDLVKKFSDKRSTQAR